MLVNTIYEETVKTFDNYTDYIDTGIELSIVNPYSPNDIMIDIDGIVELAANTDLASAGDIQLQIKNTNEVLRTIQFATQHKYLPEFIFIKHSIVTPLDFTIQLYIKKSNANVGAVDLRKQILNYKILGQIE